jgi:hypothetical protein
VASDRQQFESALRHWRELCASGRRSASWAEGLTAIVVSGFTDNTPCSTAADGELRSFRAEGEELADRTDLAGGHPLLLIDATRHDLDRVIQDPEIANLYVIGNGSLSMVWLAEDDRYDWLDVSRSSNHLKRGWVHQRQCGGLTRRLNVPLGLFMLEEPARLVAALDSAFAPPSLDHPTNECMTAVMMGRRMLYDTFVLGTSDFGQPRAERGFDDDLHQTLSGRLRQLRDIADGLDDEEAAALAQTLMERFGWDPTPFIRVNRPFIDAALADGPDGRCRGLVDENAHMVACRAWALREVADRLGDAHLNAAYLRRTTQTGGGSGV